MTSLLFVCQGNICRSPAAEAILRELAVKRGVKLQKVASCGIGGWFVGSPPDPRMVVAAKRKGYTLSGHAQQFVDGAFAEFDYILAADHLTLEKLRQIAPRLEDRERLFLMTHFSTSFACQEVPDPYYEGADGFDRVVAILEESCSGLLDYLEEMHIVR